MPISAVFATKPINCTEPLCPPFAPKPMPAEHLYPDAPSPADLIEGIKPMPPTARVLARLQHLLADPNSGLDDISALLRLDAPLVTRVIHISNSIMFSRGDRTNTIEEAVNRIGFREIYRLVAVIAAQSICSSPLPAYQMGVDEVWEESVAGALAAEQIAYSLNEDTAVAYTVGLLRSIGRRPINQFLAQRDPKRVLINDLFPNEALGAEIGLLGYSQAEVSAQMLKKWDFTPTIFESIRHQYEPMAAREPYDSMACLLYAARLLASLMQSKQEIPVSEEENEILGLLRLDRNSLLEIMPSLAVAMERARRILSAMKSVR